MHSVSKSPLLLHCTAADTVSAPERFGHDGSKQKRQEGQMFPFTSQFVLAEQIIPVVCAKMFFFFFFGCHDAFASETRHCPYKVELCCSRSKKIEF